MNKITFLELELNNYRKIDYIQLSLKDRGIVRVEGLNGSGKSSIFESIAWILYGIDSRNSTAKSIIKFGENKVKGSLKLLKDNNTYTITRERSASLMSITIKCNDTLKTFNTSKDAQVFIDNLLGIDSPTFYYLVFVRQYNISSFFELTDSYQKSFLDSVLDFSIFTELYAYYDDFYKQLTTTGIHLDSYTNLLIKERTLLVDEIESLNTLAINKIEIETNKLNLLQEKIKEFDKLIIQLKDEAKNFDPNNAELTAKIDAASKEINDLKLNNEFYPEKLDLYRDSLAQGKCIVCERELTEAITARFKQVFNTLDELKQRLNGMLENKNILITEQTELLKGLNAYMDKIRDLENNKKSTLSQITTMQDYYDQTEKANKDIEAKLNSRNTLISRKEQRIVILNELIENPMLKALKLLIEDISVLKELFGKKGIKNNFIDLYVNALSSIMNNTLKSILPNTQVRITTTKENSKGDTARKINIEILKEDNIMNYFDLSGGERKRLDLTFSLSIHSLLESLGIFSTNILIFDEAFDQLDSESIETFSNYLRGYNKESIFIITHSAVTAYADSLLVVGDYNG